MYKRNYIGQEGFIWWLGVVEGRQDPLNLGRYQVRIFGTHTDNLQLIKSSDLPWAIPANPVNNSMTSATIQEGDYVFGFFFDGESKQLPAIVGTFPGIPQELADQTVGFSDQRNAQQISSSPKKPIYSNSSITEGTPTLYPTIINEPTTSRLYRNENISQTIVAWQNGTLDSITGEPKSSYAAVPPYNRVTESESGHVFALDDTPGAENVYVAHRMGTLIEMRPDGSKVTRVMGKNYEIIASDDNVHIKGTCNITVDGPTNLTAKVINIKGDTNITGTLRVTGDVIGGGISLDNHVHGGVSIGGSDTTGPIG